MVFRSPLRLLLGYRLIAIALLSLGISKPTLSQVTPSESLLKAFTLLEAQEYEQARPLLEAEVRAGDAVAAFNLGLMAQAGLGMDVDLIEAADLFERAQTLGLPQASFSLAMMLLDGSAPEGRDYVRARELMLEAADAGYSPAFSVLSMLDLSGAAGTADLNEAHKWACLAGQTGEELAFAELISKRLSEDQRQC